MTRLMVFLSILTTLVLVLILLSFKSLPVSNEKFDFNKVAVDYKDHKEAVAKALLPKEEVKKDEDAMPVEVEIKVDLNTPELVSGNKIYNQCIACHGKDGAGKASQKAPHIGGQYDWYIEKQLQDMKSGARINPSMATIVKGLSDKDMKDVASYITKLPWKKEVGALAK